MKQCTCSHTDYLGNLILRNGKPQMYRFAGGYASFDADTIDGYHYYIADYQGNNRMVVNAATDEVEQENHYYSYGGLIGDLCTGQEEQEFKFGDKKLDRTYGLDLYDFEARQYDAIAPWFTSIDPLAEKYYSISPYAYCAGDHVNLVDPTGCVFDSASIAIVDQFEYETLSQIDRNNQRIKSKKAKKQTGVVGWFRRRKINHLQNRNNELNKVIVELDELRESTQMYSIIIDPELQKTEVNVAGGFIKKGEGISTMSSSGTFQIYVPGNSKGTIDDFVILAHELKHAYQFETGSFSISKTNVKFGFYDYQDEAEAYARGALYGGSKKVQRDYSYLKPGPLDVNNVVMNGSCDPAIAEEYSKRLRAAFRFNKITYNGFW